jgi:predicted membrane-bound spermidine synthase
MKRLLSVVFLFSGLSALMFQVVWQRLLATYYGVGPISIALIVSVYMAGLGIGALLGGHLSERLQRRVIVYCVVEVCIGIFGAISPQVLRFLGEHTAGSSLMLSLIYMTLFLFMPTALMGMTLPLLTKIFSESVRNFIETVSILYFINTIGAAAGALITSYIIISFFSLQTAVYVAASINFSIAFIIYARTMRYASGSPSVSVFGLQPGPVSGAISASVGVSCPGPSRRSYRASGAGAKLVYPLIFVTGFVAIGYEIIWFRLVGILVKDSAYAFSSTLAVYLIGIAIGSHCVSRISNNYAKMGPYDVFYALQFLIGVIVSVTFVGYFYLTKYSNGFEKLTELSFGTLVHPGWYFDDGSSVLKGLFRSFDVFVWPLIFVLVPTLLMGASFPVVAALALLHRERQGKTVGVVYFFTILGNTLGGILTGFVLLPFLGSERSVALFAAIGVVFGMGIGKIGRRTFSLTLRATTTAALLIGFVMFFPRKGELYEVMHASAGRDLDVVFEEGIDGTVVTYHRDERVRNFINGVAHGGRPIYSFYCETIEAMSRASNLRNALVIGYGTGSNVETLLKSTEVKEIIVVEVNRTLIRNLRKIPLFWTMLSNPRVHLIVDDGRRYLFNTKRKFDLITTDALWSFSSYSNNLYSQDFYRLIQTHLAAGGVYMAWQDEHRVIAKTLASVFAHVAMFASFSIASDKDMVINRERRQELLNTFPSAELNSIRACAVYLGDQSYIKHATEGYPINREWEPRTEYYLGLRALEWRLGAARAATP